VVAPSSHPFEDAVDEVFQVLNGLPFPYCLFGALALGAWGTPRTTQDLDVLIAISDSDRDRLLECMRSHGFTEDAEWREANPMTRDYHIRLHRGAIPVDLMLPRDDHDHECLSRRQHTLGAVSLWVVAPEDLVVHKLKAGRAQDFIEVLSVLQRQGDNLDRSYVSQ
jgi:hypothetical protein